MSWEPQVDVDEWGRLQIIVNGKDVTFFRDVPTEVVSWSSGDPFDDASCVIRFPQISPFEMNGVGDLGWLQGHSDVEINLVRPDDSLKVLWEGMIASIEDDVSDTTTSVSIQCIGALYQLDYYVRAPKILLEKGERSYEQAIADEFYPPNKDREALRIKKLEIEYPSGMTKTEWTTRYSGAWEKTLTGYIQRLLADMVHNPGFVLEPGFQGTPDKPGVNETQAIVLAPEPPPWPWGSTYPSATLNGTFQLEFRGDKTPGRNSANALRWNATAAQVKAALQALPSIDEVQVTGSGTHAAPWRVTFTGAKVRQRPQPLIKMYHSDLRHNHNQTRVTRSRAGEKGTPGIPPTPPTTTGVWEGAWTLLKEEGRQPVLRLRDEINVHWTVSLGAPGVSHALKSDFSQAPNVLYGEGTDESATSWRNSTVNVVDAGLSETHQYPLAWTEATYPSWISLQEAGEPTERVPLAYSKDNVRVEEAQKYGAGVSLLDARRSAWQQIARESDPGWFGTITLLTDPEEGSRFEIKAGSNIRLKHFREMNPPQKEIWQELHDRGIIEDPHYSSRLSRGGFLRMLVRLMAEIGHPVPPTTLSNIFPDVPDSHAFANEINALAAIGVAHGYSDGNFGPNDELIRQGMAGFVVRLAEWASGESLEAQYGHINDTMASSLRREVNTAVENGLVTPYPNKAFYPANDATRLEAAETMFLLNKFLGGDILTDSVGLVVHVAQVETNFESGTVDLTVDSKFRDLATLDQLIERTKSENQNPAKMLMANRESGNTDDTKFPWDYYAGSGSIPKKSMAARHLGPLPKGRPNVEEERDWFVYVNGANHDPWKRWTIVPVVMAGKGSVQKSEIRAFTGSGQPLAIPFHVGVYSMYITEFSMPKFPFEEGAFQQPSISGEALSGYDPSAVVLWGQFEQRAGYWPGLESEGNDPTGVLIDDGAWQFQLPDGENVLWVAIYAEVNAYFQGRFYHGVQ